MNILFNGCSYTWGDELEHRERDRFSTLVSNHYNAEHSNISDCGRSNDAIARTTMEWFAAGNTCDVAIIQWSIISRLEGYDSESKNYQCITIQIPKKWQNFYKRYYDDQLGIDSLFKNYFLLEQYFISNKIKYQFIFHDRWKKFREVEKSNGKQEWKEYDTIDPFVDIPTVWKEYITKKDFYHIRGNANDHEAILDGSEYFVDSKGHPNQLGHQKIAKFIIDNL